MIKAVSTRKSSGSCREVSQIIRTLPSLKTGINVVEASSKTSIFPVLAGQELRFNGKAYWIDCADHASTYKISRSGPRDLLDRVTVSRHYTPLQHYHAVQKAAEHLSKDFELLVLPEINLLYENGQLQDKEAEELFYRTVSTVEKYIDRYNLKVLTSISRPSNLSYLVEGASSNTVKVKETELGLKFSSNGFESRIFPEEHGLQTTLPLYFEKDLEVNSFGSDKPDLPTASGKVFQ